jgi:hypothetical protein
MVKTAKFADLLAIAAMVLVSTYSRAALPLTYLLLKVKTMTSTRDHLNQTEQNYLSKAYRFERAGWIFLHIEGAHLNEGFSTAIYLLKS